MQHSRRDCPIAGCSFHKWPAGELASRQRASGVRETARYRGPRPGATLQAAAREAHGANAVNHELELLTSAAQRVIDEARRIESRAKYDGRAIIEAGKRRRRELIGQVGRYGMNSL